MSKIPKYVYRDKDSGGEGIPKKPKKPYKRKPKNEFDRTAEWMDSDSGTREQR